MTRIIPWKPMDFQEIIFTVPARKHAPDVPDSTLASNLLHSYFIFDASQRPTAADMEQALAPVAMAAAPVSVPEQIKSPRVQIERLTVEKMAVLDKAREARE